MRVDRELLSVEAERKLFHAAWVIDPVLYYLGYPRDGMLLLIFFQLLIWCGFEAARKMGYSAFSASYLRPHEKNGMLVGSVFQVASLFVAVLLFDRTTAILAMLFNCIGDSVTAYAGAVLYPYLGREKAAIRSYTAGPASVFSLPGDVLGALRHHKSPVLMAVMLLTCAGVGLLFYPKTPLAVILAGGLGAVVADAFAWTLLGRTLNDDFTITLFAGAAMAAASLI